MKICSMEGCEEKYFSKNFCRFHYFQQKRCRFGYKEKERERIRIWRNTTTGKKLTRNNHLNRKYGISLNQYNRMLKSQNGVCALTGESETLVRFGKISELAVDHNQETGKIRGLVTNYANRNLIGAFESSIKDERILKYFKKYDSQVLMDAITRIKKILNDN